MKNHYDDILNDIYYEREFLNIHQFHGHISEINIDGFCHSATVREIESTGLFDAETPWGYGGPLSRTADDLDVGMRAWRKKCYDDGVVAEFIRFHPFIDIAALRPHLDFFSFNRTTILVDLTTRREEDVPPYDRITQKRIRLAGAALQVRRLGADDSEIFRRVYEDGMEHNNAAARYYFDAQYFKNILAQDYSRSWVAEDNGEPVGVMLCIAGGIFAHTHLSASTQRGRETYASYLLHDIAIRDYANAGFKWMHLGGGRSTRPDDHLLDFKKRYSPLRLNYFVGGIIHNPTAYKSIGGGRDGIFLSYRTAATEPAHNIKSDAPDAANEVGQRKVTSGDYAYIHQTLCEKFAARKSQTGHAPNWSRNQMVFDRCRTSPNILSQIILIDGVVGAIVFLKRGQTTGYFFPRVPVRSEIAPKIAAAILDAFPPIEKIHDPMKAGSQSATAAINAEILTLSKQAEQCAPRTKGM